jgi:hypothetical protein
MTTERARFALVVPPCQQRRPGDHAWGYFIEADGECAALELSDGDTSSSCLDGLIPGDGIWIAEGTISHSFSAAVPESEYNPYFHGEWRRPTARELMRLSRGLRVFGDGS